MVDQRFGLLLTGGVYSAGAVVFEGACDHSLAISQQRRSEGVAWMAFEPPAVKGKVQYPGSVDYSTVRPEFLCHLLRPSAKATSRANSTLEISCVNVSRVTTSQERSPCS